MILYTFYRRIPVYQPN